MASRERAPCLARWASAVLILAVAAAPTMAQVSPGALARPHRSLEGNANCLRCHGGGKASVDRQCLICHTEIAWLVSTERGLHGREGSSECARCHPDHAGVDFELIEWSGEGPESFDHARAGFELTGAHADLDCRQCHRGDLLKAPVVALSKRSDLSKGWLGLEAGCAACHRDPHATRLGADCASCHETKSWREAKREAFDHDRTRYPLVGRHREVACDRCHDPAAPRSTLPAFGSCDACHHDPHGGEATLRRERADCAACHALTGFRPSTYSVLRHAESAYPLEGRHADTACSGCHRVASDGAFRFHPAHERCIDCHASAHGDQLQTRADGGDCAACHGPQGFAPSTFTLADHLGTRFPLVGAHAKSECAGCHGAERVGLAAGSIGSARFAFRILSTVAEEACGDCHADPHGGRFRREGKQACLSCHTQVSFRPSLVDLARHAAAGHPLEGAHRAAPCAACHVDLSRPPGGASLRTAPAATLLDRELSDTCASCHRTPHGTQFADRPDRGDCASCHNTHQFRPATRFDHEGSTRFPLAGAHAGVPCAGCHRADVPGGPIVYRPVSTECSACHRTEALGPGGRR